MSRYLYPFTYPAAGLVAEQEVGAVANPLLKEGVVVIFAGEQLKIFAVPVGAGAHKTLQRVLVVWCPLLSFLQRYTEVLPCCCVY